MPEIRNELHLSGSQRDIEKLINSVVTPNYPMLDFAKILPVPDELASLPAGMSGKDRLLSDGGKSRYGRPSP